MTRFQKLSLFSGALMVLLLVAVIAILLLRTAPAASLSPGNQTETWAAEFVETHAATIQAVETSVSLTSTALASPGS